MSMLLIFLSIFLFVPWQVAFLGSWILHLHTCASSTATIKSLPDSSAAIPFIRRYDDRSQQNEEHTGENRSQSRSLDEQKNMHHHNMLILLLMTWLLPLAAPALAVWVRTLATAGLTTPFDGDHNFLNAAPFLVMVDFASWTRGPLFPRQRYVASFKLVYLLFKTLIVWLPTSLDSRTIFLYGGRSWQYLLWHFPLDLDSLIVSLMPPELPLAS